MNNETYFSLAEYKLNFERLKSDFVNSYIDNDEKEFISRQIKWYETCLKNTVLERLIGGDCIMIDTRPRLTKKGYILEVDEKIRNEAGTVNPETCQNLNVSFKKIVEFLEEKSLELIKKGKQGHSAAQWALYHYILQESKIKPAFNYKTKELEELSILYGRSAKNLEMRYNEISNSKGLEGYSQKDVIIVEDLLIENYPSAILELKKITQNIF